MLSHRVSGHGSPLLLLHGFGISFHIWDELRPRLAERFTLIEVELPGIGLSPRPLPTRPYLAEAVDALDSLRNELGIDRWSVIGYSTGSRVAEAYVQHYRSRVERIALLCPAQARASGAFGLRMAERFDSKFPALGDWVLSGWRIHFLIQLLGFNLRAHAQLPDWYAEITSQPVDILKTTLRTMPAGGAVPIAVPAEIPALYVWGKEDLITATPKRPSPRDVVIHADHSMPQTKAGEVAEILLRFFR
jgi:pimeloyl-ACP methyl ester carboxylesterase